MNKIIQEQLKQVKIADLTNFDELNNTYLIPKINAIKIKENVAYLIKLKPEFFQNEVLKTKWNNNTLPKQSYLKADILNIMQNMIKVMAVEYDAINHVDCGYWNGWLSLSEIDIISQL